MPYLVTPNGDMIILKDSNTNGGEGAFYPVGEIRGRNQVPMYPFSLIELAKMNIPLTSPTVKEHIKLVLEELAIS